MTDIELGPKSFYFPPNTKEDLERMGEMYPDASVEKLSASWLPENVMVVSTPVFCELYGKDPNLESMIINSVLREDMSERDLHRLGLFEENSVYQNVHSVMTKLIMSTCIPVARGSNVKVLGNESRIRKAIGYTVCGYGLTHLYCIADVLRINEITGRPEMGIIVRGAWIDRDANVKCYFGNKYSYGKPA